VISLLLLVENEREEQILKLAFEQNGLKVILTKPTFQNYILVMQYNPDLVVMELPHLCSDQFNFAARIRSLKKTRQIPIIGYGNKAEAMVKRGMAQNGVSAYIERPLKF
jgi:response regulator RpfG family c-di-GMP phosphodiesterase